jgi:hypothetical protein
MIWDIHDKEFASVSALPGSRRYTYFLKRVADWGNVWSLAQGDGWALASDESGQELVPVWPHPRFAAACASGVWTGYAPRAVDLAAWMDKWIPGMHRDKRSVAVFPIPSHKGVIVTPDRLNDDLKQELSLLQ